MSSDGAECVIDVCTSADGCGSVPFYYERTGWPLVHATVPGYLYFVTRRPLLSLFLMVVWEIIEALLSIPIPYLREHRYDSLIGDPLIGGTSILIFFALDAVFNWQLPFRHAYGGAYRTVAFVVVGLLTPLLVLDDTVFNERHVNVGALLFGFAAALFTVIYFLGPLRSRLAGKDAAQRVVRLNVLFVAGYVLAMTAAVAYRSDDVCSINGSAFLRVLAVQWATVALVLLVFPYVWHRPASMPDDAAPLVERSGAAVPHAFRSRRTEVLAVNGFWRAIVGVRDVRRTYVIERAPFWREPATFPFAHAVVPLALYFTTRNLLLSLLLIYVWETIETLISTVWSYFREKRLDSLLGDPLVGALGIFAFAFLDATTGWDERFRATYDDANGRARRIVAFVAVFFGSAFLALDRADATGVRVHFGVALFTLLYAGVFVAAFNDTLDDNRSGVLALLTYVVLMAIAVFIRERSLKSLLSSIFLRVLVFQVVAFVTALLIWLLT